MVQGCGCVAMLFRNFFENMPIFRLKTAQEADQLSVSVTLPPSHHPPQLHRPANSLLPVLIVRTLPLIAFVF